MQDIVDIKVVRMSSLSLSEQVTLAASCSVYVTAAGGGALTAMFAPAGASLVFYYDDQGRNWRDGRPYDPAMLDWDIFNSATYVHTNWLPISEMDKGGKLDLFNLMVGSEIEHWLDGR